MVVGKTKKSCEGSKGVQRFGGKTQGTILLTSSRCSKWLLQLESVGEMSGWRTNAARNTMSDWETAGRVLVEARVGTLCMGIMRLLGNLFLPQAKLKADRCARTAQRPREGRGVRLAW
jgi:hypothetical protein